MGRFWVVSGLSLAWAVAVGGPAEPAGVEFSAQVQQRGPQGVISTGRLQVGGHRMRTEMSQGGRRVIQIIDYADEVAYTLDPEREVYVELHGPGAANQAPAGTAGAGASPCDAIPGARCTRLGEEEIAGRPAVKWEVRAPGPQGAEASMTQWIDSERGTPVRSESPDGTRMTLEMKGRETVNGRSAEKWEMTVEREGGQTQRSYQWYDPNLKLAIREEFPGGYVRELTDIRIGPQPDSLFRVPEGYRKMSAGEVGQR